MRRDGRGETPRRSDDRRGKASEERQARGNAEEKRWAERQQDGTWFLRRDSQGDFRRDNKEKHDQQSSVAGVLYIFV